MLQAESTATFMYGIKKITIMKECFQIQNFGLKIKTPVKVSSEYVCYLKFYSSTKTVLASMDNAVVNNNDKSNSQKSYCYCQSEEFGEMIACDSITCSIEWFHVKCLHLLKIPKGKWYCPNCQKSRDRNKR